MSRKAHVSMTWPSSAFEFFTINKDSLIPNPNQTGTTQGGRNLPLVLRFPGYPLCFLTVQIDILPGYEPKVQVTTLTRVFKWRTLQKQ